MSTTPWPDDGLVVTDAGLETWLLYQRGVDLPAFAAYPLLDTEEGRALLQEYYTPFLTLAAAVGAGIDLETPTWRANPDWAATLGHGTDELALRLRDAVDFVAGFRSRWTGDQPFLVGGTIGPRGDGYVVGAVADPGDAERYHSFQVEHLADAGVDLITAMTIGDVGEAIGIARAARATGVPAVISFTVETDGRLPTGVTLGEAIARTDDATDGSPLHYMVNCAHPEHFADLFDGSHWTVRLRGVRANASTLSHAELDVMEELDRGDVDALAAQYAVLHARLPRLQVVGGCCGTDHQHVAAMAAAVTPAGR